MAFRLKSRTCQTKEPACFCDCNVCTGLGCSSQPLPAHPVFLLLGLLEGLNEAVSTCFHKDLPQRAYDKIPGFEHFCFDSDWAG